MARKKGRRKARKRVSRPPRQIGKNEAANQEIPQLAATTAPAETEPPGWFHLSDLVDNPSNTISGWNGSYVPEDLPQLSEWLTQQREFFRNDNNWGGTERPGTRFPPPPDWQDCQIAFGRFLISNIHAWLRHYKVANRPRESAPPVSEYPSNDFRKRPVDKFRTMGKLTELIEWLGRKVSENEIIWFGDRRFGIGLADPVIVTAREAAVLGAFLEETPLDKSTLEAKSRYAEAVRILRELRDGYGGIFSCAIVFPGARGKGGYHVRIRCDL
jgi:hypothetical protein